MKKLAVVGLALFLTACTGGSGFDSVRNVEETMLQGQTMLTVVELLGPPYASYVVPDGEGYILAYDTTATAAKLSPLGCILLLGLAGGGAGNCPEGGQVVRQCVALRFGPDRRVIDIDRPMWSLGPCSSESDDRFLPAIRRPFEEISQ